MPLLAGRPTDHNLVVDELDAATTKSSIDPITTTSIDIILLSNDQPVHGSYAFDEFIRGWMAI